MHQSTLITLIFLTFVQISFLMFGFLILWLKGEFGDAALTTIPIGEERNERSILSDD